MQARRSRSALLACTALAVLSLSAGAFAQEAPNTDAATADSTTLQPVVVKGKRVGKATGASIANTPLASETTSEQIAQKEIRDLGDLGNTTEPGVDYVASKPGRTGGLFIRGLTGPRVSVLVDDIPLPFLQTSARSGSSGPTTGINGQPDSFDFYSLAGVDVLRGADSSKIGSGALAGALAARTLEPADLIGEGHDWGGVAKAGYDSEDNSAGGSVALAKSFGDTSVLLQSSYTKGHESDNQGTDDIFGAKRTEPNPMDYVRQNLLFKFRHQLEGGHMIGFTAERYDYQSDSNLKSMQAAAGNSASTYMANNYFGWDDTRRERLSLDYGFEAPNADSLIDTASLRVYWQRLKKDAGSHGMRSDNINSYTRANTAEERDIGAIGSLTSNFEAGGLDHEVRLRGNIASVSAQQYILVYPETAATFSQADIPDVHGTVLGLTLEDQVGLGDSGFSVTPGIRFDWHDYRPQESANFSKNLGYPLFGVQDTFSDTQFSPKLLVERQLTPDIELFAQWSMAYRAPTLDELYGDFSNPTYGYASIGNPALEAETGQGFEIGTKWNTGDFSGGVTLFHTSYDNFIDAVTKPNVSVNGQNLTLYTYENRPEVSISGIELKARKDFVNGFFLEGSMAFARGKYGDTGADLRSVAPFKSIVGIGYQQETWGTQLTGIFSAAMRDDNDADTFDAPGYGVFNLTGWWEPEAFKGLRVQAGVYNIFDKTYWNAVGVETVNPNSTSSINQPVAFYSEPGRTFKISLTQKF